MTADAILQMLRRAQSNGTFITTETLDDYDLGGIDCKKCDNTGALVRLDADGTMYARECDCMKRRRSLRRIRSSGMSDMLERYTFDSFETPDSTRKKIKSKAQDYVKAQSGWFYIAGQSGSGKSHICTAICSELIKQDNDVYYMSWRDDSRKLKASINEVSYEEEIKKLKRVSVLYIDDFFKGGCSDADVRLAFEILNYRYNDKKLRTIISSEIDITQLLSIDEALGGRIYERSRGFVLKAPAENWRLR